MGEYRESKTGARLRFRRVPVFLVAARFASHWSGRKAAHVPLRAGMMSSSFPSPHPEAATLSVARSPSLVHRLPAFPLAPAKFYPLPPPLRAPSTRNLHISMFNHAVLCHVMLPPRHATPRLHPSSLSRLSRSRIYIVWRATASVCIPYFPCTGDMQIFRVRLLSSFYSFSF